MCRRCPRVFTEPQWDGTDETCVFCFVLLCFFYLAFAFPRFTLVNYVRERNRKIFHFLRRRSTRFVLYLCRSCEPSIIVSNFVFFRLAASAKSEITAQSTLLSSVSWSFRVQKKLTGQEAMAQLATAKEKPVMSYQKCFAIFPVCFCFAKLRIVNITHFCYTCTLKGAYT